MSIIESEVIGRNRREIECMHKPIQYLTYPQFYLRSIELMDRTSGKACEKYDILRTTRAPGTDIAKIERSQKSE